MRSFVISAAYIASALFGSGCVGGANDNSGVRQAPAGQNVKEIEVVEKRLSLFLDAAVLTHPDRLPDSLVSCDPEWDVESRLALARSRVLGASIRGDTAQAWAEVTSVVSTSLDAHVADVTNAVLQVRIDTLHWTMTKDGTGRWGVCGYSKEGIDFTNDSDTTVRWSPKTASWKQARAWVDSIRRAEP